jgi:DNA topoisomerase-1
MEKNLDRVESGEADWRQTVDDFYQGFAASLESAEKNMEGKKVKVPDEPSGEVCELCGKPMVIKQGKYGKFLACSGFPDCRNTKRLVKDTGGICPKCGQGRMLERKSSKGRIYYGCERYPDCDFMTWDIPVATKCEKCGATLFRKGMKLYCAKEGCGFEMPVPKKGSAE